MAIAHYVPPEYGPPPNPQQQQEQQQQQQPVLQNTSEPEILDILQHHSFHQDANNNNFMWRRQEPQNNQSWNTQIVSLVTGLVTELLAVFGSRENNTYAAARVNQRQRQQRHPLEQFNHMRRPAAQRLRNFHTIPEPESHPAAIPTLIPSTFRALPDVISCHAGISFHYKSSSYPELNQRLSYRERPPVVPLSPTSSLHSHRSSNKTVNFKLGLKLGISVGGQKAESLEQRQELEETDHLLQPQAPVASPEELYRILGANLRAVGDLFQHKEFMRSPIVLITLNNNSSYRDHRRVERFSYV